MGYFTILDFTKNLKSSKKGRNFLKLNGNIRAVLAAGLLLFSSITTFADAELPGKAKSAMCMGCHGPSGVSQNPLWPNLAGQKQDYLEKQLNAFRSGDRKDPLMSPMAANLSEEDVRDLALFYSKLAP